MAARSGWTAVFCMEALLVVCQLSYSLIPAVCMVLTLYFFDHVIDDVAVLALRAEHDDLRVGVDLHVVPRRPVEEVVRLDRLALALRIGGGDLAVQHEAPVRAVAVVAFQALEQRRGIDARRQREVLAADLAEAAGIADVRALAEHRAGDSHRHVHPRWRYSHAGSLGD